MKKTELQWFKTLPIDIQKAAIKYRKKHMAASNNKKGAKRKVTFWDAIAGSFLWNETKEGVTYWSNIANGHYQPII